MGNGNLIFSLFVEKFFKLFKVLAFFRQTGGWMQIRFWFDIPTFDSDDRTAQSTKNDLKWICQH